MRAGKCFIWVNWFHFERLQHYIMEGTYFRKIGCSFVTCLFGSTVGNKQATNGLYLCFIVFLYRLVFYLRRFDGLKFEVLNYVPNHCRGIHSVLRIPQKDSIKV